MFFARYFYSCFYMVSAHNDQSVREGCTGLAAGHSAPTEKVRCFCCGTFSEAQNEHLAAEVCEVTVHTSRFDSYLQWFGTCHFENEQTAAEGPSLSPFGPVFNVTFRSGLLCHFSVRSSLSLLGPVFFVTFGSDLVCHFSV